MRLLYFFAAIGSMIIVSCNNNGDVKTGNAASSQENQLRELAAKYPDSVLLKENLVEYLRQNGDFDKAIAETESILQKDDLNAHLLSLKATLYYEKGDTAAAISTFEKAISINPQPEYVRLLGSIYAQTGNSAALTMAEALRQVPSPDAQKEALFIKGLYYNYAGDKLKAIPLFDSCLKMDYRYMLAYREKAICLYDLSKYTEALTVLKQATTVQHNFEEGYYWLGRCYEKLNNKKEAIDSYQAALNFDPGYVEAREALQKLQ